MAGRGPQPKDPARRARTNKEPVPLRIITAEPVAQPKLPPLRFPDKDGNIISVSWPVHTRAWWRMWADSPLSDEFTATDWSELMDTAILHGRLWRGDHKVAGELRLRTAKYGATPEDRARLRITFATADQIEAKDPSPTPSSRARRGGLKALPAVGE